LADCIGLQSGASERKKACSRRALAAFLIQLCQSTVMLVTVYEDREKYLQRREVKYQSAVNLSPTAPRPESAIASLDESVQ
jgi:hypothetical protein